MSHRNPNRRERAAAKAYAQAHGLSYQTAVQTIRLSKATRRGFATEMTQSDSLIARVTATLDNDARAALMRSVEEFVAERGVSMNEFTPLDLVEGDIEESTLVCLHAAEIQAVEDAELMSAEGQPSHYGVHARLVGDGDVDWYVSAPSGYDVASFGDSMGGDSGGPGLVQELESVVPVQLHVWGKWNPANREWTNIEVQYARMPDDEIDHRGRRHSQQETRRLQAAGIMPSDDEITAMVYPSWKTMDELPRLSCGELTKTDAPTDAGVYAFYRADAAIYVGKASSLRTRIWGNHLSRGLAMTNSAFRRNVVAHLQIAAANDIKTGAYRLTEREIEAVRTFIDACEVAWIVCGDPPEAAELERQMKREWIPPLTRL